MIRDPSDGSVREPKADGPSQIPSPSDNKPNHANDLSVPTASGLPPITKNADQLARLEKARDWLKNYLHRKPEAPMETTDELEVNPDPTAPICARCGAQVHDPCPTDEEQAKCELPDFCFPQTRGRP